MPSPANGPARARSPRDLLPGLPSRPPSPGRCCPPSPPSPPQAWALPSRSARSPPRLSWVPRFPSAAPLPSAPRPSPRSPRSPQVASSSTSSTSRAPLMVGSSQRTSARAPPACPRASGHPVQPPNRSARRISGIGFPVGGREVEARPSRPPRPSRLHRAPRSSVGTPLPSLSLPIALPPSQSPGPSSAPRAPLCGLEVLTALCDSLSWAPHRLLPPPPLPPPWFLPLPRTLPAWVPVPISRAESGSGGSGFECYQGALTPAPPSSSEVVSWGTVTWGQISARDNQPK